MSIDSLPLRRWPFPSLPLSAGQTWWLAPKAREWKGKTVTLSEESLAVSTLTKGSRSASPVFSEANVRQWQGYLTSSFPKTEAKHETTLPWDRVDAGWNRAWNRRNRSGQAVNLNKVWSSAHNGGLISDTSMIILGFDRRAVATLPSEKGGWSVSLQLFCKSEVIAK